VQWNPQEDTVRHPHRYPYLVDKQYSQAMGLTTLKVPVELRDRIAGDARARQETIAAFLQRLVDDYEHQQRMEAVGRAMREKPSDEEYWTEFAQLDAIGGGLTDA
jgi:hypothetical protein